MNPGPNPQPLRHLRFKRQIPDLPTPLKIFLLLISLVFAGVRVGAVELAKPTPDQRAFMDMELGVFFHFDLNTFTGQEHGDGKESPKRFNPTALDCDQWVRTAKSMGAKYAVLTARHEGGFCLWPTATTEYSIKNSPYKNGQGDIVREFVDACHKYGLKVGLYHTAGVDSRHTFIAPDGKRHLGDDHGADDLSQNGHAGDEKYTALQVAQLTELLTNYGEISYIWSDHWSGGGVWRAVTDTMRKLQPHCLMQGPDVTTAGNENGYVTYPLWNAINTVDGTIYSRATVTKADHSLPNDYGLLETDVLTGHPFGKIWRSRESDTNTAFERGGWFWHPGKTSVKSLAEHVDLYYRTIGLGANLIVNLPPDDRGLIPDDLVAAAKEFGNEISRRFSKPIAQANEVRNGDMVELKWPKPCPINTIVLRENIADGQKIAAYTLEARVSGDWVPLLPANHFPTAKPPFNPSPDFETIGQKKIDRVEPVVTDQIRFRCLKSIAQPTELRSIAVYDVQ
ncbi:MAG TPA: alpha-L-fucosidase [Chthoniobacter sp.]|jgi:alpha-L-fucosidase